MTALGGDLWYIAYIPVLFVLWILIPQFLGIIHDTRDEWMGPLASGALVVVSAVLLFGGAMGIA